MANQSKHQLSDDEKYNLIATRLGLMHNKLSTNQMRQSYKFIDQMIMENENNSYNDSDQVNEWGRRLGLF